MNRIQELEKLITKYQHSYYTNEAEISDEEFDMLWDELKILDPENPILKKIGSDIQENSQTENSYSGGNFEKATHLIPMGSQEKAADPNAFLSWTKKVKFSEYIVEYKLDGASLELQYENGKFVKGVTRGNGIIGDDITANVLKMKGLVKELKIKTDELSLFDEELLPFTGGIRGEVIMSHEVHQKYFSDKANCRNAANGLMKRKDGDGSEHLQIICYDAFFTDTSSYDYPFKDEVEKMKWLEKIGFTTSPLKICKSPEEVIEYRATVMETRKSISYDIDGLVIKGKKIDLIDAKRNRPEKQIAFKFSLEEAISILRDVIWSESGATYTPIGIFDTVELAGTKVKRASLVNTNTIKSLDVKIGSHVVVTKRGEIIPKIERVIKHDEEKTIEIEIPSLCSVCGTKLIDEGTRLYCPNKNCTKKLYHQIEKWINVLDIRDFGIALLKWVLDNKKINSISDIYKLTEDDIIEFFLNEESLANAKESLGAKKVIASIKNHTEISLSTFIAGFDIEGIGELSVDKLVNAGFDSLEKLINATEEELASVNGFGEILAATLKEGLKENSEEILHLINSKSIKIKSNKDGIFAGKTFCFTGELFTMKRADAESLVKSLGGTTKSSVVKDLSYLVTNDTSSGSSKNRKAQELGIPVIDEKTFLSLAGK